MGRPIGALLLLAGLALMPPLATGASWPPSDCYEGHAWARGTSRLHEARLCMVGPHRAELEVFFATVRVHHVAFDVTIREELHHEGSAVVHVETWRVDGQETLRFAYGGLAKGSPTFYSPAAGGGHVREWNLVALRHYP